MKLTTKICIWLYNQLKKRDLLENTVFVVTADHGFSYSGNPIREKAINTFYLENFKIPFYAFGPCVKQEIIESIESSASIPSTICEIMNIQADRSYMLPVKNNKDGICFIEYCGGGCPDLRRREIMLAAFDKNRMVAFKSGLKSEFSITNISEVYNLKDDPKQRKPDIFLAKNKLKWDFININPISRAIIYSNIRIIGNLYKNSFCESFNNINTELNITSIR